MTCPHCGASLSHPGYYTCSCGASVHCYSGVADVVHPHANGDALATFWSALTAARWEAAVHGRSA